MERKLRKMLRQVRGFLYECSRSNACWYAHAYFMHNYFAQIEHLEEKQERGEQLDPEQVHLSPLRSVI